MSRRGRRPDESASKSAHSHVINDAEVQAFLARCEVPPRDPETGLSSDSLTCLRPVQTSPIRHIVAIDGGFTEVDIAGNYPSASLAFFQFGVLVFSMVDLEAIEREPFIDPKDMSKLRNIDRMKLVLPIRNIGLNGEAGLRHSIRRSLHDFLSRDRGGSNINDALAWLVFERYRWPRMPSVWSLASCPHRGCSARDIPLRSDEMRRDWTFRCLTCGGTIYLADILRLHEAIDEEVGAGGILGYITTALEQIILAFVIKALHDKRPRSLDEVLFVKDGPLAYFGQTANLFRPMRQLVGYLQEKSNLYLVGLEKSGAFVEHADQIARHMKPGDILLLGNDYIYRHILPGRPDAMDPYGRSTYYSVKLIFKAELGGVYVATIPTAEAMIEPERDQIANLDVILHSVQKLRCDMYDSALLPVALVNKLVSLADHPSAAVLQAFAKRSIGA